MHVELQLRCGPNASFATTPPLARVSFVVPCGGGWAPYNFTAVRPSADCTSAGSVVIWHTGPPGAQLLVDMVLVQPGAWGRFKGLPVKKRLAEFLLGSGMAGMRMGGGTIGMAWRHANGTNGKPGSGYLLRNFRGPRWERQPLSLGTRIVSAGWGIIDFVNFCEAANLTAALTLNERDDPALVVEYLFGDAKATAGGQLRALDGHMAPYAMENMLLEVRTLC